MIWFALSYFYVINIEKYESKIEQAVKTFIENYDCT